jgi:hypothetical protein
MFCTPHQIFTGNQIKKNEVGGICGTCGDRRGACRDVVGRPDGYALLGRFRLRWEDNIKTDPQEVGCGGIDWIVVAQNRDR